MRIHKIKLFDKSSEYIPLKPVVQSSENSDWLDWELCLGASYGFLVGGLISLIVFISVGTLVALWQIPVVFLIIGVVFKIIALVAIVTNTNTNFLVTNTNLFNGQTRTKDETSYVPTVPTMDHESSQDDENFDQKNATQLNGPFSDDCDIITGPRGANLNDEFRFLLINH